MDLELIRVAQTFAPTPARMRLRFGKVVSVQNDRSITVTIGGDTTQISGIPYLGSMQPRPNAVVVLLTDGADLFAVDHVAANDGTIAPRATRSTNQSIPDGTDTAISFDGSQSDAWGCWDAGNAARLTAPVSGRYMAIGQVAFEANGTGWRRVWIEKNGTSTQGRVDIPTAIAGSAMWVNVTAPTFDLNKDDYVRLMVRQNSGGAVNVLNSSTISPSLSIIYLGP